MIRLYMTGRHARRAPLSYAALWPLFDGQITHVTDPRQADLYVFAHVQDIQQAPREMVEDWRQRRRPVVLLSEEPFWDTIWGKQPLAPMLYVDTAFGALPVRQLNHHTCNIFRFDRIPYYLLTHHRFANAYGHRFARNAALGIRDWQDRLAAAHVDIGFMFERRPEPHHDVTWPEGDIIGLCAWRTRLAEACRGTDVQRWGRSWGNGLSRFDLETDWHLDKLVRLDGACRVLGAIENTHQPDYITEKLFDAFACGSVPVYHASPGHRIHDLGLPADSWVNLYGLTAEAAAAQIEAIRPTRTMAAALAHAQQHLHSWLGDPTLWQAERQRLGRAVLAALEQVLNLERD